MIKEGLQEVVSSVLTSRMHCEMNVLVRCDLCLRAKGSYFQHVL
jgi:hypothetical protein